MHSLTATKFWRYLGARPFFRASKDSAPKHDPGPPHSTNSPNSPFQMASFAASGSTMSAEDRAETFYE